MKLIKTFESVTNDGWWEFPDHQSVNKFDVTYQLETFNFEELKNITNWLPKLEKTVVKRIKVMLLSKAEDDSISQYTKLPIDFRNVDIKELEKVYEENTYFCIKFIIYVQHHIYEYFTLTVFKHQDDYYDINWQSSENNISDRYFACDELPGLMNCLDWIKRQLIDNL